MARVLASSVRMMNQTCRRSATEPRHTQRIRHDVSRHTRFQRPANHLAIKQIKNNCQVQPAFIGPQVRDVGGPHLIRCTGRKVPVQQVLSSWQIVFRVRSSLVAALVTRPHIVVVHQSLNACFAGRESTVSQFPENARAAIRPLEFGMNGLDQCQHLRISQPLAAERTTSFPGAVATHADRQHPTHFCQTVFTAMMINPGVLHRTSFAKYASAFFMISFSRLSRTFSARSLESSICSADTVLLAKPVSAPRAAAPAQLRSVCSFMPSSLAADENDCPSLTRLTASSLNSSVYDCRGIFIANFPSNDVNNRSPRWKTKYQGKLNCRYFLVIAIFVFGYTSRKEFFILVTQLINFCIC